jgi:hypothetical protein
MSDDLLHKLANDLRRPAAGAAASADAKRVWTKGEVYEATGISHGEWQRWHTRYNAPWRKGEKLVDIIDLLLWLRAQWQRAEHDEGAAAGASLSPKNRKLDLEARRLELQIAEAEGRLMPRADAEQAQREMAATVRQSMLVLARDVADRLVGLDAQQIQARLGARAHAMLQQLARGQLLDTDNSDHREAAEVAAGLLAGVQAADLSPAQIRRRLQELARLLGADDPAPIQPQPASRKKAKKKTGKKKRPKNKAVKKQAKKATKKKTAKKKTRKKATKTKGSK